MNAVTPNTSPSGLVPITKDEVIAIVPAHLRTAITQNLVDTLNNISADYEVAKTIRDNFISYTSILKEGKFKTEDYLSAVSYVSFKLMGLTNEESYSKTFPQRYATLVAKGTSKKDIASYVAAYHKGKLVNLIMEQSIIPSWVLNQDIYQKAINTQVELMTDPDVSAKVRSDAANSILNHLKKPENTKTLNLNVNESEAGGLSAMSKMLSDLAQRQKEMIESQQMKTIDVASSRLPFGEE